MIWFCRCRRDGLGMMGWVALDTVHRYYYHIGNIFAAWADETSDDFSG